MSRFDPIAIIGQSCLLPGRLGPEALWEMVVEGRVALAPAEEAEWDTPVGNTPEALAELVGTRVCGVIRGFTDLPKPPVFDRDPDQITALDPVFQWSLYVAAQALQDAGQKDAAGLPRTGLILGNLSYPTRAFHRWYEEFYLATLFPESRSIGKTTDPRNRFMSGLPAQLIRRALGLEDEAFALDAACASGLYALKLACDRLQRGQADMMLAAAVNATDPLFLNAGFKALRAISPSGRSRPFHREADGLIPANGAACVVLKRLPDALRDRNRILGVVRGIGLSNDGRTGSFVAPSSVGQVRCMQSAFGQAGIAPAEVAYVECHATGTAAGDATEIQSLMEVFGSARPPVLGSLKANIGHPITVSGLAGLIKVLGAMAHATLPPTPNAFPLQAPLAASSFRVLQAAEPWRGPSRIACVSSFGFGGNNAHLIVEKWPPDRTDTPMVPRAPVPRRDVAVVALAVRLPGVANTADLLEFLLTGRLDPQADMDHVALPVKTLAFPPKDLERALGQQLLLLELAGTALKHVKAPDPARTGVFVGMGIDPDVARFSLQWRIGALAPPDVFQEKGRLKTLARSISPGLTGERVIGAMPNIPANRLSNHYDFKGPGFTVSGEECSGDQALTLAAQSIAHGEIDTALVGAADFSDEKAHIHAARTLGVMSPQTKACDAGVLLVLKRLDLAVADGDQVLGTVTAKGAQTPDFVYKNDESQSRMRTLIGHSHAASGLLHVAAALLLVAQRACPARTADSAPTPRVRPGVPLKALVRTQSAFGARTVTALQSSEQPLKPGSTLLTLPKIWTYAGQDKGELLQALQSDRPGGNGPCRIAFPARQGEWRAIRDTIVQRLGHGPINAGWQPEGFAYGDRPVGENMAFVYTGAASAYAGMGRSLLLTFPGLAEGLGRKLANPGLDMSWIDDESDPRNREPYHQLMGASLMCQVHTLFSRNVLGLRPQALIGLSAGETNALFAFDIWRDMDRLLARLAEPDGAYARHLGGRFEAVATYWGLGPGERVEWQNWRLFVDVDAVRASVAEEPRVYLTIIYSQSDCMIGGDSLGCARVIRAVGKTRAIFLDDGFAIHCPAVTPFADTWRRLHTRKTFPAAGIRIYANHFGGVIDPTPEMLARASTGQALETLDFPKLIENAWQDGVRLFVEHGPRDGLSTAIGQILKDKPHLAVAWDKFGQDALAQAWQTMCLLWCAGAPMDLDTVQSAWQPRETKMPSPQITVDLRQPPIHLPQPEPGPLPADVRPVPGSPRRLPKPPTLAPVLIQSSSEVPAPSGHDAAPRASDPRLVLHSRLLAHHQAYLKRQHEAFAATLELIQRGRDTLTPGRKRHPQFPGPIARSQATTPGPCDPGAVSELPGPKYDRTQLEALAEGPVSAIFGPAFAGQDAYAIQVRMPGPPLLLADRITGIAGAPCSLETGTIWSETDVTQGAWYLHHGRMPAGIFVESGQADLLLVSWLGADTLNRGERAYRLLGCELTYHGGLPRPGDLLQYRITVTGYARQGRVRLFFFESDCLIDGQPRLSVRNGQAGFFTPRELEDSGGVFWDPVTAKYHPSPRLEIPAHHTRKTAFSMAEVAAYAAGDMVICFGQTHALTATHTRSPRSQSGKMNFIGRITDFTIRGGPAQRGYLCSEMDIDAKAWYFDGHFKNDPCMPGTLMAEAGLQLMAFYAVGLGLTIDRDGWRFEPVAGTPFTFVCRGQVVPASRKMRYELFVDEVTAGSRPTLVAHLLCTVDGVKAFLCERMALRLVPDWPLFTLPELMQPSAKHKAEKTVAQAEGIRFDFAALMHAALGQPSRAFGPRFAPFDHALRSVRLPSPPYHFVSRITALQATVGSTDGEPQVDAEYDLAPGRWYWKNSPSGNLPLSVLMEIGLQPCGWLAAFTLAAEHIGTQLFFRNLDGTARMTRPVTPDDRCIRTRTTLISVFSSQGIIIEKFKVVCTIGAETILKMHTAFGFFPPAAMAEQRGLPPSQADRTVFTLEPNLALDLNAERDRLAIPGRPAFASGRLLMLERIVHLNPTGGRASLGAVRAEKNVSPRHWYFKAHFFQDPVQPGSLGVEAIVQALHFFLLHENLHSDFKDPVLEPVSPHNDIEWHYRGQVTPVNHRVTVTAEILEIQRRPTSVRVSACAALWADGRMIYQVPKVTVGVVAAASSA